MQQPNYRTEMFDEHPNLRAKLWCAGSDCEFRISAFHKALIGINDPSIETIGALLEMGELIDSATPKNGEKILNKYWKYIYENSDTSTAHIKPG